MHIWQTTMYTAVDLPAIALTESEAIAASVRFARFITIEPPSFRNAYHWRVVPGGIIGLVPLTATVIITVAPITPFHSLAALLELGWEIPVEVVPEVIEGATVPGISEQFVLALLHLIEGLARHGLARTYVQHTERGESGHGRIAVRQMLRQPLPLPIHWQYTTLSTATPINCIIRWTLYTLLQHEGWQDATRNRLRATYHVLSDAIPLTPLTGDDARAALRQELPAGYRPVLALCSLILETVLPAGMAGTLPVVPFLLPMPLLFERVIGAWLTHNIPSACTVSLQERTPLGFAVDIVVREASTQHVRAVIDTKYKADAQPTADDLQQIIAYAQELRSPLALLVYPVVALRRYDRNSQDVHIVSVGFDLSLPLDVAGAPLLQLLSGH